MKLTPKQILALQAVAEKQPGYYSAWCLGTSTCEALRKRGLVNHHGGDRPFSTGWRDNENVYLTDAGRTALQQSGGPDA